MRKITAKDLAEITQNIINDRTGEDAKIIRSICMLFALELAVRGFAETSKIDERKERPADQKSDTLGKEILEDFYKTGGTAPI